MPRISHQDRRLLQAVGQRMRAARLVRGISQEQLAEVLSVAPETISRYETGTVPMSLSVMYRVAGALGVEPSALMGAPLEVGGEQEQVMLEKWRLLDKDGQRLLLELLHRLVP